MTTTTTVTTTGTTTERPRSGRLAQVSVRTRITVVIALLTAAAMAGAGLLVYALESARIERAVNEPDRPGDRGVPPSSRRSTPTPATRSTTSGGVLDVFLTRNVPDDDEMLVGYVDGARTQRTANRYGQEFLDEPAYQRAARGTRGRRRHDRHRVRGRSARSG